MTEMMWQGALMEKPTSKMADTLAKTYPACVVKMYKMIYVNLPTRSLNISTYSIIILLHLLIKTQVIGSVGAGTSENHKPAAGKARKPSSIREERSIQRNQKRHNGLQGE